METRKTGGTNDRQDLLAEMLGVMTRLRAAEEPSPADAEPRRDAGSKGARGRGVALCTGGVRLRARLVHNHVQARQGGQATVPPRARPELQYREHAGRQAAARAVGRARPEGWRRRAARGAQAHPRARGGERPPEKAAAFFAEDQARPRAAA